MGVICQTETRENLDKLRLLTEKINETEFLNITNDYKCFNKQLKALIKDGNNKIDSTDNPTEKEKYFQIMCANIITLTNKIKTE